MQNNAKKYLFILLITLGLALTSVFHLAIAEQNYIAPDIGKPIVVELFTSQGCSSCPPADKILEILAQNKNVIALGCHVSYWDSDYSKDNFSQDFCDMRQHGYASLTPKPKIYTPQMIINGQEGFIGSRAYEVNTKIKSAQNHTIESITVNKNSDNNLIITLPNIGTKGNYRIWAYGYKGSQGVNIPRGENAGRMISYTNPVLTYNNLGPWDGFGKNITLEIPSQEINGIAILAQDNGYGKIIAAGKVDF